MSGTLTPNLGLFNTNMLTDGDDFFDFDRDLNNNNNILDTVIGNLSNLSTVAKDSLVNAINEMNMDDRLHALKSYKDEGEPLTDIEGFLAVNSYATSDFDISKFTKVGSPIISNDGVMSNISASNYVKIDTSNITYSKSLEIIFSIRRTSLNSAQWFASSGNSVSTSGGIWLGFSETNQLRFFASSGNGSYDIANNQTSGTIYLNELTKYYIKLVFTGEKYIISYSKNKISWTEAIVVNSSTIAPINNVNLFLGYGQGAAYFQGDYFLNEALIKADSKPVFTGNVTGIDTVKPVNYTPVGSPTITDDGIASDFSATSYITKDFTLNSDYTNLEIDLGEVVINELPSNTMWLYRAVETNSGINKGLLFGINNNGNSRFLAGSGDTNWGITGTTAQIGNIAYSAGQKVKFKLVFDGATYKLLSSVNGSDWAQDGDTITSNKKLNFNATMMYGSDGSSNYFKGSLDLNGNKIIKDRKVIYQPCLLIPYAKSSTDSKIVYSYYRDRVVDVFNQKGKARYFTLSDTDFTLPMGEIYGMMNTVVDSYINGTSGYRVYEDGYCEQWGYIATNSSSVNSYTVTLLIPYKDTNYIFNRSPYWAVDNYPTVDSIYDNGYRVKTKSAITFYMHENSLQTGTEWNTSGYIY